jgi:hypothetical protein
MAVEPDDAAYYQRTATKPPIKWDFLLGPKLQYADQLGLGIQAAWIWHASLTDVMLIADMNYVRVDAIDTTRTFERHGYWYEPHTVTVPVHVDGRVTGQYGVGVLFRLHR